MYVPLSVNPIVKRSKEKLNIWYNGKQKLIDAPIKPYFYSYEKLDIPSKITQVTKVALSKYKERTFYKYEFPTRKDLTDYKSKVTFEDNIPFILRNRIDNEDLYTKFPHTDELNFLFLDIEQYSPPDKMFPTYEDRIISIAWCGNDRIIKSVSLKKDTTSDKKLLLKFIEEYKKINPDVIVVYNKTYDIPTILHRCVRNKIDTAHFSKNNEKPYLGGKSDINIEGVVIYDVLLSARADQSLTGNVVNRGLKEVSNWFGYNEDKPPLDTRNIHKYIGTKELVEYNKDDVKRLLVTFDIYWPNIEFNANDLKIPLNIALDLNITDLGLIVVGDEYRKYNIIADGSNYQRYPEIFQHSGRGNYEGALVDIYRTGLFEPVYKADYSSMYPSIVASFNLSPDTTTLLEFKPLGKFKIEEEDNWFIYHIPDNVLKKNMVIQVSKQKEGFCARLVRRFLKERAQYKKKWKETGDRKYRAMSDNRKVKANGGVYGIQGSANHAFGFAPIAMATTGIGRQCAQLLIDITNDLYPNSAIEIDTDGLYFTTKLFDRKTLIQLFNERLQETFKKELELTIDIDSYHSGYFYKTKNYVLKKDNKIIYHGAALKARSKDLLSKSLIQKLAKAKLDKEPIEQIIRKYQKLDFPLKYFAMNVTMGRHMNQYKNMNALAPRLARQAETHLGIKPEIGIQYHYVKCNNGYKLLELANKQDIDRNYYRDEVNRVISMFDIEPAKVSINKWL